MYMKVQLIRGITNDTLQVDLQAKAGTLKSFKQNICHAKVCKSTFQDQNSMATTSDINISQMEEYATSQQKECSYQHQIMIYHGDIYVAKVHERSVNC